MEKAGREKLRLLGSSFWVLLLLLMRLLWQHETSLVMLVKNLWMSWVIGWRGRRVGGGSLSYFPCCCVLLCFFYPFGHEDKLHHAIKCLYTVSVKGKETSLCERWMQIIQCCVAIKDFWSATEGDRKGRLECIRESRRKGKRDRSESFWCFADHLLWDHFPDFLINFHIFNQHNYRESKCCHGNHFLISINLENDSCLQDTRVSCALTEMQYA